MYKAAGRSTPACPRPFAINIVRRNIPLKKLLSLFLVLALLLSLSAVSFAGEKKVLRVASWDTLTGGYLAATETAFEEAFPDVDLQYVDIASQDYFQKATTILAGGDNVDVIDIKELSDVHNWVEQGYVESLDSYVEKDQYNLGNYLGLENNYRADGALYGLPYRSDFWVLFYNKTLFDAAGVDYPTNDMTWEEYAALAEKMTQGDGIDKIYGSHYHTWLSAAVCWAVTDGKYTLADGHYEPLKYYYDLVLGLEDKGVVQEYSELRAANLHYSGVFYQGKTAMMPMGYWFAATLIAEKAKGTFDFDWSFVSVPHHPDIAAGSSFGSITGSAMNKNANDKDLAWQFISWRASEAGALAIAKVGTRPGYVSESVAQTMAAAEGFPKDDNAKAALVPTAMSLEWPIGEHVNAIKTIVNEEHTLIMTREVSVEEGIEAMNARVAEVIGQ